MLSGRQTDTQTDTFITILHHPYWGVEGNCAKHLTIEFYTVVLLLTFILIISSIPLSPHSFIPGLKPPFSANPSHRSLPFFL